MSFENQLNQIRKKQIPPIILLYGTEPYFIQNFKNELIKNVLKDDLDNLSSFDLDEIPIEEVITDVETYPFFGERKLIIATNPTFLTAKRVKLPFNHNIKQLEQYIHNPVDYSVLALILNEDKLDQRKKITKLLKEHAFIVDCSPIKEQNTIEWINKISKDLNIRIDAAAMEILELKLTNNLYLVQNELMKLAAYIGENGMVTKEIAEELVSHTEISSSLKLVDAVIERNLEQAFAIYKDLKKLNEEPIGMIALLAFQFRTILQVKLLKNKGYSQYQIARQLRAHSFVIKIASSRERLFSIQKLKNIIHQLTETDAMIKQGRMEQDIAFELLLYDLIHAD